MMSGRRNGERGSASLVFEKGGEPTHLLLYLNSETWLGDAGKQLAREVTVARAMELPIVMLHENDPAAGGCEFGLFFQTTPQELIHGGLYQALALAFYPDPFRHVSCCLAARALGAGAGLASCFGALCHRAAQADDDDIDEILGKEDCDKAATMIPCLGRQPETCLGGKNSEGRETSLGEAQTPQHLEPAKLIGSATYRLLAGFTSTRHRSATQMQAVEEVRV